MASPLRKPWETNYHNVPTNNRDFGQGFDSRNTLLDSSNAAAAAAATPPVPPRPNNVAGLPFQANAGFSSYSSSPFSAYPYSSSYGGGLGGYGGGSGGLGYGSYSGYGALPGRYLYGQQQQDSDFMQVAEQSSRQAFRSIENIVQAFSSVAMMLESSLTAVYTSFRAVLGVADNFSRLKAHLQHVLTTLFVVKALRYLWRRLLVLLRMRPATFAEELWESAGTSFAAAGDILPASGGGGTSKPGTNWPLLLFFAVAVGGPWAIWKLISKIVANVEASKKWASGEDTHFAGIALYEFRAGGANELSLTAGTEIRIAPKEYQPAVRGWLLASIDGQAVGLVPANYVRILGKRKGGEFVRAQANEQREALRENEMERLFEEK